MAGGKNRESGKRGGGKGGGLRRFWGKEPGARQL